MLAAARPLRSGSGVVPACVKMQEPRRSGISIFEDEPHRRVRHRAAIKDEAWHERFWEISGIVDATWEMAAQRKAA